MARGGVRRGDVGDAAYCGAPFLSYGAPFHAIAWACSDAIPNVQGQQGASQNVHCQRGVGASFQRDQAFYSFSVVFPLGGCVGLLLVGEVVDVLDFEGCQLR
jgi:hypothetical protein